MTGFIGAAIGLGCVVSLTACTRPLPEGWSYTTRVTSTGATVVWTTRSAKSVSCRSGSAVVTAAGTAGSAGLRYARLGGLLPDTVYRCRFEGTAPARSLRFRTAPERPTSFRFAVVGDTGDGSPVARALARRILAGRPAFLVHLGDFSYAGAGAAGYERAFFRPYRRLLARVPLYPTPGNHDIVSRSIYRTLFAPAADMDDRAGPRYAFAWGDGVFASVSSMGIAAGGVGARWLGETLRGAPAGSWRIVLLHEPPYAPGTKWVTLGLRRTLQEIFDGDAPPQLVLAGHAHRYARSLPICNGTPNGGTLEIISGGGGANLDPPSTQQNFPVALSVTHYARVTVGETSLDVRAVDVDGRTRDHVRIGRGVPVDCRRDGWPLPIEKAR